MRESGLQRYVVALIRSRGGYAIVTCPPIEAGTPDVLACIGGHFVGIETKAGRNQPSRIQKERLREIKAAGGTAVVIRSRQEARSLLLDIQSLKHSAVPGECSV